MELRARSSVGLEHLPSKQRVAGSNPAGRATWRRSLHGTGSDFRAANQPHSRIESLDHNCAGLAQCCVIACCTILSAIAHRLRAWCSSAPYPCK